MEGKERRGSEGWRDERKVGGRIEGRNWSAEGREGKFERKEHVMTREREGWTEPDQV